MNAAQWPFPARRTPTKSELDALKIMDSHAQLLKACLAVDADVELTGRVSAASIDMVRNALALAKDVQP